MNLKVSSLLGAFAVVATTAVLNASPAEAVQLSDDSTLNLAGNVDITGIGPVTGSFNFLDFELNDAPGLVGVIGRTGDFTSATPVIPSAGAVGTIQDLSAPIGDPASVDNFIVIDAFEDFTGLDFDLATISQPPELVAVATGTTVSLSITGDFDVPGFDETFGTAVFSADILDLDPDGVIAFLSGGGTLEDVSFSARFTVQPTPPVVVPEPSATLSLIALGVVGGMFGLRNRKQFTA